MDEFALLSNMSAKGGDVTLRGTLVAALYATLPALCSPLLVLSGFSGTFSCSREHTRRNFSGTANGAGGPWSWSEASTDGSATGSRPPASLRACHRMTTVVGGRDVDKSPEPARVFRHRSHASALCVPLRSHTGGRLGCCCHLTAGRSPVLIRRSRAGTRVRESDTVDACMLAERSRL